MFLHMVKIRGRKCRNLQHGEEIHLSRKTEGLNEAKERISACMKYPRQKNKIYIYICIYSFIVNSSRGESTWETQTEM